MTEVSELEVRKAVRERYAKLAAASQTDSCCGDEADCCAATSSLVSIGENLPAEVASINAGCGSPLQLISPKKGGVVLDLGSGGGIDVLRASALVGEEGKAIGVDATPEMVWRAREMAAKYADKYRNVEFRLGEIENLPVESNSVDYAISNCVINLSPNKQRVSDEVFRVLRPNGVLAVADITIDGQIPESARKDMDSWSACVSGAISASEYRKMLASAGFADIDVQELSSEESGCCRGNADSHPFPFKTSSSHIKARKPA